MSWDMKCVQIQGLDRKGFLHETTTANKNVPCQIVCYRSVA